MRDVDPVANGTEQVQMARTDAECGEAGVGARRLQQTLPWTFGT
jgi:hypothetical protein